MAIAIPMLLGYHPEESLVVSCLRGPAVDLTMRFDLADLPASEVFAVELADRIRMSGADIVFVAVFTANRPHREALPYAGYIDDLYADPRLRIVEAVLVSGRRWWSYLCPDPECCPPMGRPLDAGSDVATSLSAAFALSGAGTLADRGELVSSLETDPHLDVTAARQRVTAARRRAAVLDPAQRLAEVRNLTDTLVARFADPRAEVSDGEVASLAGLMHDVTARDEVLVQAVTPYRRETLLRVLRAVARHTPAPLDAAVCTALAWFAYADGDGTTANIALDRALDSEPEYSLALLIGASLDRQLPPAALVEVIEGAVRDLDARDTAG